MADRTSAGLFGSIFEMLADDKPIDRKAFAARLWKETHGYDFSPYQLECDDALIKLGLAKKCGKCGGVDYIDDNHEKYCEPADGR